MEFTVDRHVVEAVVTVAGELDADNAYDVYLAAAQLAQDGFAIVVIDLAQVTFIDSTGLGMLVRSRDELGLSLGSHLRLQRPSERVRRMLELTALTDQFDTAV